MTLIDGQLIREHIKQECQKYKSIFQAPQKEVAIIRFEASENASNELRARYEAAKISAEQKDDERDCFPAVLKIINKYKPKFAAIENVTGLLTCPYQPGDERGYFRYVLQQLSSFGYDADWLTVGSGHTCAPFIRERVLLVAVSRSLELQWQGAATWTDQARGWIEGFRIAATRRGIEPGYPLRVVRTPAELARPLGVKSGNGIIRKQRAAAGNMLDPGVAAIALRRIVYLNQLSIMS